MFLKLLMVQINGLIQNTQIVMRFTSFLGIAFGLFLQISLGGQTAFQFAGQQILPGIKKHLKIPITHREQETFIPITVFHGTTDGPVLGITAGVHGYEYAPILASQELIHRIDPTSLSGTVILVQIANLPSFLGRSPFTNPQDNKNLNRSFPGDPNGTMTERMANFISRQVIARCDYFVDMHSGDAPEDLMPYVAYYQNDEMEEASDLGHQMATHMGFDHVILFKTTGKDYMQPENPSLYCSAEAFKAGIPSVDVECGRLGIVEPDLVQKITIGVESLLKQLKMLKGSPIKTPKIAFIENRTFQSSAQTGFFYPLKGSGDYVVAGMKVGYITDVFNQPLEDVYADQDGVILFVLGTPPVNKGETLLVIGKVESKH